MLKELTSHLRADQQALLKEEEKSATRKEILIKLAAG